MVTREGESKQSGWWGNDFFVVLCVYSLPKHVGLLFLCISGHLPRYFLFNILLLLQTLYIQRWMFLLLDFLFLYTVPPYSQAPVTMTSELFIILPSATSDFLPPNTSTYIYTHANPQICTSKSSDSFSASCFASAASLYVVDCKNGQIFYSSQSARCPKWFCTSPIDRWSLFPHAVNLGGTWSFLWSMWLVFVTLLVPWSPVFTMRPCSSTTLQQRQPSQGRPTLASHQPASQLTPRASEPKVEKLPGWTQSDLMAHAIMN